LVDPYLASLLLDLHCLSEKDAEAATLNTYAELYLDCGKTPRRRGTRTTHDNGNVKFVESRFQHAFYSATQSSRKFRKDKFDRQRAERVGWLGPVIAGQIDGTVCYSSRPRRRSRRGVWLPGRFYLVPDERYVVWLESSDEGNWWFSSAYVAYYGDIRRYCREARLIWTKKNIP